MKDNSFMSVVLWYVILSRWNKYVYNKYVYNLKNELVLMIAFFYTLHCFLPECSSNQFNNRNNLEEERKILKTS